MIQSLFAKPAVFAITISVALAAAGPVGEPSVQEDGPSAQPLLRIAATDDHLTAQPNRYGFRNADSRVDERLPTPRLPAEAAETSDEKIIAAFPVSASETVAEVIAKDYKLELIDRNTLRSLGLSLIRYRVPDARPLPTVIADLRADGRVIWAQVEVRYNGAPPMRSTAEDGSLKKPPLARTTARQIGKRRASVERAPDRKTPGVKTGQRRTYAKGNERLALRTRVSNLTSLKLHSKERCFKRSRSASLSQKVMDRAFLGPASRGRRGNRKGRVHEWPMVPRHRTGLQTSLSSDVKQRHHKTRGDSIAVRGRCSCNHETNACFSHSMQSKGYTLIAPI